MTEQTKKTKKYLVDVFARLAQTIEVEAASQEEAEELIDGMLARGEVKWSLSEHRTDDFETEVVGEVGADGGRLYYC